MSLLSGTPVAVKSAGLRGRQGFGLLHGEGPPAAGLGRDGEYYRDTLTNEEYGPKSGGNWGAARSLVGPQGASGAGVGYLNHLINGGLDVSQRGNGPWAVAGISTVRGPDMMRMVGGTGGTWSFSRAPFTPGQTDVPDNPAHYIEVTQSVAPSAGTPRLEFPVENVATLAGRRALFSFWGRVLAGTLQISMYLMQHFGSGGSASVFAAGGIQAVILTTTWQRFTWAVDLPSIAGKTLGAGHHMAGFVLGHTAAGFNFHGQFANFQIEKGAPGQTVAAGFERRPRADAETACRRYYQQKTLRTINGNRHVPLLPMRAAPTITLSTGGTSLNFPTADGFEIIDTVAQTCTITASAEL